MAQGLYDIINNINQQIKAICCKIENLGPGGASIWGDITGTLSDQTDLQDALDAKILTALPWSANHTNATGNQYVIGDVVYYSGNIYRCIANNDSIIPTSALYWVNLGVGKPLVQEPVDWNSTSGNNQILNKPAIPIIPQLEYNNTDLTIWNNGKGNIISNTSFGDSALKSNTTGTDNVALGYKALEAVTVASRNIGIGFEALSINTSFGNDNVAIGYRAGKSITTGSLNVAIGNNAFNNGNASYTTAIGYATLQRSNINGNTGVGSNVMSSSVISGAFNTGVGFSSLSQLTSGQENTAIGFDSLTANTTGSNNSALGSSTQSGNFSGSVLLGKGATATANNQFVVGSVGTNAGTVTNAAASQTHYWSVKINGTDYKILLST